jgi:hypothetical protein
MDINNIVAEIEADKFTLPDAVLNIEGYSSRKVRELLNRLTAAPNTNYLEIGIHTGSTFCPAIYKHQTIKATAIDNWSLFGNCRPQFEANLNRYKVTGQQIQIIEQDCFTVDLSKIYQPVNVYFFDGDHGRRAQYLALVYFSSILADKFTMIVDDFNWAEPREETYRAIKDLGYKIEYERLLPARIERDYDQWWNGLWVAQIGKS